MSSAPTKRRHARAGEARPTHCRRSCRMSSRRRRLCMRLLGASALVASCCVFYGAAVVALYLGPVHGAIGFVVWFALAVAGIACLGEPR